VSLTLTPMMASRFLKPPRRDAPRTPLCVSERAFDALLRAYARGLDVVLRFRFITLCVFFATVALSAYLFVIIPKGFFPQQTSASSPAFRKRAGCLARRHDAASAGAGRDRAEGSRRRSRRNVHRAARATFPNNGAHVHHP
jgi:hypothetical protein